MKIHYLVDVYLTYLILADEVGHLLPRVLPEEIVSSLSNLPEVVLLNERFFSVGCFPDEGSRGLTIEAN